jgi:hypothetical protein
MLFVHELLIGAVQKQAMGRVGKQVFYFYLGKSEM